MSNFVTYKHRAETFFSLLVAVALLSIMILGFGRWQTEQSEKLNRLFQQKQAVLLLENQIALLSAGLRCENQQVTNGIRYQIQCEANRISIHFPLGKIELNKD